MARGDRKAGISKSLPELAGMIRSFALAVASVNAVCNSMGGGAEIPLAIAAKIVHM
jgi:hypothetical protein